MQPNLPDARKPFPKQSLGFAGQGMLPYLLAYEFRQAAARVRGWSVAIVGLLALIWLVRRPVGVAETVEMVTWGLFFAAILIGGALTGWRVTQFPKTRAAEFLLVAPVDDGVWIVGRLASGMLLTACALFAATPLMAGMWGAGWIDAPQAVAMLVVPLTAGWLAGIGLASVAYSSVRLRVGLERLAMVGVTLYLVLFGLMGGWFFPWFLRTWQDNTGITAAVWYRPAEALRFFNPFRLLGMLGQSPTGEAGLTGRIVGVVLILGLVAAALTWRLAYRLRDHYVEENYGPRFRKKEYRRPVGDHPLSWWTIRRVSRFRGRINIYLAYVTIGLFTAWMLYGEVWPPWLAYETLYMFETLGGQAMLGAFALQYALVATAFLPGLWDSTPQQRASRFELLLVSPCEPSEYLLAGAAAGWTRGKWYLGAMTIVWTGAVFAGRIGWGAWFCLHAVAAVYCLAYFALAFRNFTRLTTERDVGLWGLGMSVGFPCLTVALFWLKLPIAAACTPLGAAYLLALPVAVAERQTGLFWPLLWGLITLTQILWAVGGINLLEHTLARCDRDLRAWYAAQSVQSHG